jgi:hypothetical protein
MNGIPPSVRVLITTTTTTTTLSAGKILATFLGGIEF